MSFAVLVSIFGPFGTQSSRGCDLSRPRGSIMTGLSTLLPFPDPHLFKVCQNIVLFFISLRDSSFFHFPTFTSTLHPHTPVIFSSPSPPSPSPSFSHFNTRILLSHTFVHIQHPHIQYNDSHQYVIWMEQARKFLSEENSE